MQFTLNVYKREFEAEIGGEKETQRGDEAREGNSPFD
jgi:hypothetical protein